MANGFNFGGGGDNAFNRQRLLGQMLLRGSQNTQNITSPFQVAGNLAQAFVGGRFLGNAQEQEQQRQQELARVLQGATGALTADNAPARPGAPGGGTRQDRLRGATRMLASNPQTAPMALQMGLKQAQQEPQGQSTILTGQQVNEQFQGANVDPGGLFRVNPQTMEFEQVAEGQGGDLTQTERQVQRLRQRGFSQADAEDIAFGRVDTVIDDFGRVWIVNEAQGTKRLAQGSPRGGGREPAPEGDVEIGRGEVEVGRNRQLEQAALEGTGPFAAAKDFANRTIGAVFQGEPFPRTTAAKQKLRIYNQQIKAALTVNPKNPVAELETIQGFLPDPDRVLTDPEAELRKLRELKGFLMRRSNLNSQQLENRLLSNDERKRLVDQNAQIAQALQLMETFGADMPGQDQPEQDGGDTTIRFQRDEEGNLVPVQ